MHAMDDDELKRLADAAGLALMLKDFPADLREAAETVARQRAMLPQELEEAEPWPPMRIPER